MTSQECLLLLLFTSTLLVSGCGERNTAPRSSVKTPESNGGVPMPPKTDVEDGGVVENVDRDKAEAYLVAIGKVRSAEEEKQLLSDFGKWLVKNGYKVRVAEKNGKHELSCPCFPPVTPWTDHTFFDIKNLELLPR